MARIISVANQKGGVGKTTTVLNLGSALYKEGKRVLLVDLDPQAALSTSLAVPTNRLPVTVYQVLLSQTPIQRAVRHGEAGLDLIPANIDLAAAELELAAEMGREHILAEALAPVRGQYDFILIDCPPSLGLLTINALVAAGEVVIPLQCEYLAMRGMNLLLRAIDRVKAKLNPDLEVAGILVTMYNARTVHAQEVLEEVRTAFGRKVFPMVVGSSVRFKEAPAAGQSILDYAALHEGAAAYRALAKELLQ
jgi:chromosome partitioning protein